MVHTERVGVHPLDAVIVCGMGPVELLPSKSPDIHPVPSNIFNVFNAVAAKIMVAKGWANEAILSGFRSRKEKRTGIPDALAEAEVHFSEGAILERVYRSAHPSKGIHDVLEGELRTARETVQHALSVADTKQTIEDAATTTFRNILEGLNLMEHKNPDGYFSGTFAVISPRFHGPRIKEMLRCFGLTKGRFLAAEDVVGAVGYQSGTRGFGAKYDTFVRAAFPSQPAGLQNLYDNPSYVTKELASIQSPRRFYEVAHAVARYYQQRRQPIPLPDCFTSLPDAFDPAFDYDAIKPLFAAVPFSKHPYIGDGVRGEVLYRKRADRLSVQTQKYLVS